MRFKFFILLLAALFFSFFLFAADDLTGGSDSLYPSPPSADDLMLGDPEFQEKLIKESETQIEKKEVKVIKEAAPAAKPEKEDLELEELLEKQDKLQLEYAKKRAKNMELSLSEYSRVDEEVEKIAQSADFTEAVFLNEGLPASITRPAAKPVKVMVLNPEDEEKKKAMEKKAAKEALAAKIALEAQIMQERQRIEKEEKEIFAVEISEKEKNEKKVKKEKIGFWNYVLRSVVIITDLGSAFLTYEYYSDYVKSSLECNGLIAKYNSNSGADYEALVLKQEEADTAKILSITFASIMAVSFAYTILDLMEIHAAFPVEVSAGFEPGRQTAMIMVNREF